MFIKRIWPTGIKKAKYHVKSNRINYKMNTALPSQLTATLDTEDNVLTPTPTQTAGRKMQVGGFASLTEALDYAAEGETGVNFYNTKGTLEHVATYHQLRRDAIDMAHQC